MRFGVFFLLERPPWRAQEAAYHDALEQAAYAEALGFDAVWLAEHHFSEYGICPSLAVMGAAVAQRTRRVRIGTAVAILPFQHPLRIAEEYAMLDILSGGRLDFGVGRGYQPAEYDGFGVPMEESRTRFDEGLEVIKRAWTQERVTFEGTHYRVHELSIFPRPVQRPHPPIWIAAVSPETFARVGRLGERFLSAPSITPPRLMRAAYESYRQAWLAAGHPATALEIPALWFTHVAEDEASARRDPERYLMWYFRTFARVVARSPDPTKVPEVYRFYAKAKGNLEAVSFEQLYDEVVLFGDPERVTEKLARLREELGLTYLIAWMNIGGMENATVQRSMRLFAEKVIPRFR